jgi:serine/threonine protein kinase/Flp pilus assembly protein TadD
MQPAANLLESILAAAVEVGTEAERRQYVERACAGDAELRQRVEEMIENHFRAGNFLESPVGRLAATVDHPAGERPGTMIGPYKLLEQIGEGGFGAVFMAEQQQPVRRKVALKVLKPGMDTRHVVARFEAERQALALMDHPHIARVLDGGEAASGRPYFVMELVRGLPMTDYCDQNHLGVRERLELFVDVCQAVQHAHQKGIIHRDLKPSNVLVTLHDGTPLVKVIDFGIAKALGQQLTDKTLFTGFAQMIGTPLYMSPEQAALSNDDVDTRSDVYSLGVLLYEVLTGTTPFDQERLKKAGYDEMRRIIREEEPPRPSTRISTMGQAATTASAQRCSDPKRLSQLFRGELDWIVMKALEKDRNRRYESPSAFAADVRRYLSDEPVQACPPSAWYRFHKFARRNRTALAVSGLVVFCLAVLLAGGGWFLRERAEREAALNREENRLMDEADDLARKEQYSEALARVERADKLLKSAGRTDCPPRLVAMQQELGMAQRLDDIYRELDFHFGWEQGARFGREQDARFARAFQEFGIDVDALEPAECVELIRAHGIHQALVRALDAWAVLRRRGRGVNDPGWKKLVEVARQADQGPLRNQVREALLSEDRAALEKMADTVPVRTEPPTTHLLLGVALQELGAGEKAMSVLRQAQRQYPDDLWLLNTLGWFCHTFRPNRVEDAVRYYAAASALRPQSSLGHRLLAMALEFRARDEGKAEAMAEYDRAIELAPGNSGTWRARGEAHERAGQHDQALADYTKALEVDPTDGLAHHFIGQDLAKRGRWDEAIAKYQMAARLAPNNQSPLFVLSTALGEMKARGRLDKYLAAFAEAARDGPEDGFARAFYAIALGVKGRGEDALVEYRAAHRLLPDNPHITTYFRNALVGAGRHDEAIAEYKKELARWPNVPRFHSGLGDSYNAKGLWNEAIVEYRKALSLDPGNDLVNQFVYGSLGDALQYVGRLDEAVAAIREKHQIRKKFYETDPSPRDLQGLAMLEQAAKLDKRLPAVLEGKDQPKDAAECLIFAKLCPMAHHVLMAASARFFAEAFARDPKLAEDLIAEHRLIAARVAGQAGCGLGRDAVNLDEKERARLRGQALDWLRADLAAFARELDNPKVQPGWVAFNLHRLLDDPSFKAMRGSEVWSRVPEAERQPWKKLWDDIAATQARAQQRFKEKLESEDKRSKEKRESEKKPGVQ